MSSRRQTKVSRTFQEGCMNSESIDQGIRDIERVKEMLKEILDICPKVPWVGTFGTYDVDMGSASERAVEQLSQ